MADPYITPLHPDILAMSDDERRALAEGMTYDPAPGANLAKLAEAHRSGNREALRAKYDELFPESEELSKS